MNPPGTDELAVRRWLRRRGLGPNALTPVPAADAPPRPAQPPTVHERPAPPVGPPAGGSRYPNWRTGQHIDISPPAPAEPEVPPAPQEPDEPAGEEQQTPGKPRPSTRARQLLTGRRPAADGDQDEESEAVKEDRRIHMRPTLGRPPGLPPKRLTPFEWVRGMEPHVKWGIYHSSGLIAGWYVGVPQWALHATDYVTAHPQTSPDVIATYAVGVAALVIDFRFRHFLPPLAWAARALTVSLIVGVLWHGNPIP